MRKINKRKRRTIIIVTVLILIVFGAYLIIENINNDKLPPIDHEEEIQEEEASNEPEPAEEEPMEPEEPDEPEEPIEPEEPAPNQEAEGVEKGILIENPDSLDVIVNKKRNLPENYVPEDLTALTDIPTVLSNPEVNQLRKAAYEALKELFDAAKEEGYELHARSGYRSYYTQASLYTSYVENYGKAAADKYSAKPGQSEHQTGLSMDITCEAINYKLDTTFGETEEGKWVAENAHRYGFIIRYPKGKEDITGYAYEPWHIRYLGVELAEKIYESGLTLEEYFQQ
ncbi:MAG: M15 family metallopeptidase [Bacillota bacterium]|jgi:D-alanyl-D-alanine carboxypeptidase|nr:M15 family metallopeptidase [Bacillota bacterium]